MMNNRIPVLCALILLYFSSISSAAEVTAQRDESSHDETPPQSADTFPRGASTVKDKLVSKMMAGVSQGYDSNANLGSPRKDDFFLQETADMHFSYPLEAIQTDWKFGFNLANVSYYEYTDADMLDMIADSKFEYRLLDSLLLIAGYQGEFMVYPNDENGSFFKNEVSAGLRHTIARNASQTARYAFSLKEYTHRKILYGNLTRGSDLRLDARHDVIHELSVRLIDRLKVTLVNQYSINDSNDQYFDFYDFWMYKSRASLVVMLVKRLYVIGSFSYFHKEYTDRPTSDRGVDQKDNLYVVSSTLLWDLTASLSLFCNYSYKENDSNEPLDQFSGNMMSAGLYYSF